MLHHAIRVVISTHCVGCTTAATPLQRMSTAATQPVWGNYMASLIIGTGVLIHGKIKDKKELKREAKRKAYEKRYQELEDEHKKTQMKSPGGVEKDQTELNQNTDGTRSDEALRTSYESERSEDGPSRWVSEARMAEGRSQVGG